MPSAKRRYIGIDLAWGEGSPAKPAHETGLVIIDPEGRVLDADWKRGIDDVAGWIIATARPGDVIAIDAPLIIENATGMRECERQVGQRYGRWRVSANPSNLGRPWLGGVALRLRLEAARMLYTDGLTTPPEDAITFFECYPYTALVGAHELEYEVERPRYKRPNRALDSPARRPFRAAECDELLLRMSRLATSTPPLNLASHPVTAALLDEASPVNDIEYKHREDLLDAAICAWTAALWSQHGLDRCQILGADDAPDAWGRRPTIIAPARLEQRR